MIKKILVPLDGSDLATEILPQVKDLAKCTKAEMTLLTVGPIEIAGLAREFLFGGYEGLFAQLKTGAEKYLAAMEDELTADGIPVHWLYREGAAPAEEIISYAEENAFDLIAMATHGRGRAEWAIGSVAEKVLTYSAVPVLLLRVLGGGLPVHKKEHAAAAA